MGWRVFAERLETTDLDGSQFTRVNQKVTIDINTLLVCVRTWLVVYNNPTFTSIKMHVYSDTGTGPGTRLYTSESVPKAFITTYANGAREVPFAFYAPNGVWLQADQSYYLALEAVGYTGSTSSHLAWKKAWPDPVYSTGVDLALIKLGVAPYALTIEGAEVES